MWVKEFSNKFISFLKRIKKQIHARFVTQRLKRELNSFQKDRLKYFQDMGERIYELKKNSSFELIDLAAVNEYMDKVRKINKKTKKTKEAIKQLKRRQEERLPSWWSRRGSNP